MNTPILNINDVTQAIQLALGPAFLLTAVAGLLNVMTGRLARIIDRGRHLTESPAAAGLISRESVRLELSQLERRRHVASAAITACTLAALLVCLVIASLFIEVILGVPLHGTIGLLFTGATVALIAGLGFFLIEVHLATRSIRIKRIDPN
jgi:hypothetical protein